MHALVRDQLPDQVRKLVDSIEAFGGTEIQIAQWIKRQPASAAVGATEALIVFPDAERVDVAEALHELLHIQRNWPEGVPQLVGSPNAGSAWEEEVAGWDNMLEHLVIVPRMKDFGFAPYAYWNVRFGKMLEARKWRDQPPQWARKTLLKHALPLDFIVDDPDVRAAFAEEIRRAGLETDAASLCRDVRASLTDKPRVCAIFVRYLDMPPNLFRLAYCDPRLPDIRFEALPSIV